MADRSDFTDEEWLLLREAAYLVALAACLAGSSRLTGSIAEGIAVGHAFKEGAQSADPLIAAICSPDQDAGAREALQARFQQTAPQGTAAVILPLALEKARTAVALLGRRSRGDAAAYGEFLNGVAQRVAEAAKEGSFLGFGGERLSAGEQQFLAELAQATRT